MPLHLFTPMDLHTFPHIRTRATKDISFDMHMRPSPNTLKPYSDKPCSGAPFPSPTPPPAAVTLLTTTHASKVPRLPY
jgi:hypothetical protein